MAEIVVNACGVGKCYQVYGRPRDRLLQGIFGGKYFTEFWALRAVDLQVARGETVGVIGRNGSGKSTLLQVLCKTVAATEGLVEVKGRVAAILELGAGFHPEFTGRENVQLVAQVLGLTPSQITDRMAGIIEFSEIGEFIDRPVKTYSSGMFVRLAFSVIAHVDAQVLVIDEALAVGDVFFVQKCMRFMRAFQQNGGTIILVSHDAAAITSLCHRVIWLDGGKLRKTGAPKEVLQDYLAAAHGFEGDEVRESYGAGGIKVESVSLLDLHGAALPVVHGGEAARVLVKAKALRDVHPVIVGFFVRDRLGQNLFGDNTFGNYHENPVRAAANQPIEAAFSFIMPRLPAGDYTVTVGIAEGTQEKHELQHWVHEGCSFRSMTKDDAMGLVGIPMTAVELKAGASDAR